MADTMKVKKVSSERRVSSGSSLLEKLNDYLRVTSPAVWVVLAAVILLLIGVCIWGALGHIDSTVSAAVISDENGTVCLVPASALEGVVEYRTVTVEGQTLELAPSVLQPQAVSEDTDVYVLMAGDLSYGDVVYPVEVVMPESASKPDGEAGADKAVETADELKSEREADSTLPEGIYVGRLLIEKVSPMSLFFN